MLLLETHIYPEFKFGENFDQFSVNIEKHDFLDIFQNILTTYNDWVFSYSYSETTKILSLN